MADEPKISRRYRELSREEPPRHLDDAILAASRRAVAGRKRQSWYVPLAAAAIIVLAVAVTVHVDRERPNEEMAMSQARLPEAQQSAPAPVEQKTPQPLAEKAVPERRREFVPDPKPAAPAQDATEALAKRGDAASSGLRREAPARAAPPPPPLEAQRQAQEQAARDARQAEEAKAAAERAPAAAPVLREQRARAAREEYGIPGSAGPLPTFAHASPEQLLQGIADLRRQGRHEDADKALAEFRRLYPDHRISEEMRAKVERGPVRAR
jgi:hypothetical protein